MRSRNKPIFVLLAIIVFFPFYIAKANLEINEIMYDLKSGSDAGREWVELFNNSEKTIDTSPLQFFEADTNHKLLLIEGDKNIPAYGYFLIVSDGAKFKIDWPNSHGNIFDSTFSLNNTGEALAIKNKDTMYDTYTYSSSIGGAGDGNSLQKINGAWIATAPTPGVENRFIIKPKITQNTKPVKNLSNKNTGEVIEVPVLTKSSEALPIQENNVGDNWLLPAVALIGLIFIGSGAIYFIRVKHLPNNEIGNDFEVL